MNTTALDFDDVLILPRYSTYDSRKNVELRESFRDYSAVPLIVSNMATTGTFEIAKIASQYSVFTAISKFYAYDDWKLHAHKLNPKYLIYSIGGASNAQSELNQFIAVNRELFDSSLPVLMIDVANGYADSFSKWILSVRRQLNDAGLFNVMIIAGNVVTEDGVNRLYESGADIVKVGIGSGAVCKTRVQTGIGLPQYTAVEQTSQYDAPIISDGGIKNTGDIAKAFAAGASFVMVGSMFAGFTESGGDVVDVDGELYKSHYGMSSKTAQRKYYGHVNNYRSSEGRSVLIPYRGDFEPFLHGVLNNLRSTITYTGVPSLTSLVTCDTVKVNRTHETVFESIDTEDFV